MVVKTSSERNTYIIATRYSTVLLVTLLHGIGECSKYLGICQLHLYTITLRTVGQTRKILEYA